MDWYISKLGDVCELIKRGVGPKYLETGGICVINQKCIRDHEVNYGLARRHDLVTKKVNEERFIKVGDVLVNSTGTGTLGRVAQIRTAPQEQTTVDTHVTIVRPKPNLFHNDFFGYMLIKIEEEITAAGEGASGQTELARTKLENEFLVSYPNSIPEQKRIVAILDQAFADIEQARGKTEQNLKNARELFESYLENVSGEKKPLGDFVTIKTGRLNSNAATEGGQYPFFTCSRDVFSIDQYSFDCEAILLAGNNASGDFNVKHYKGKFDAYQRTYVITINDENTIFYHFLYYQMLKSLKELKKSSVGAGTRFLKIGMIKDLKISIPPITKQQEILGTLLVLKDEVDKLEGVYKEKLVFLDELKKSILQKAFSGELTKTLESDANKGAVA